jgi:hypothetical protein
VFGRFFEENELRKLSMKKARALSILLLLGAISCEVMHQPGNKLLIESPMPTPAFISPLPSPTAIYASPTIVLTPNLTQGTITGRLINSVSGAPIDNQIIYLGDLLPMEPGPAYLIIMKQRESPNTVTDKEGWFIFPNLAPGTYALILWTPGISKVIIDAETNKELLATVEAGKITNLGEIRVEWP